MCADHLMRRHTSYRSDNIGKAIYDFRLLTFHLPRGYSNSHLTVKEKEKKSKIHFSESVRLEPLATAAPSRSLAAPPGIKPSCRPLQFASKTSTGSTLLNNQKGAPISRDKTKERTITEAVRITQTRAVPIYYRESRAASQSPTSASKKHNHSAGITMRGIDIAAIDT